MNLQPEHIELIVNCYHIANQHYHYHKKSIKLYDDDYLEIVLLGQEIGISVKLPDSSYPEGYYVSHLVFANVIIKENLPEIHVNSVREDFYEYRHSLFSHVLKLKLKYDLDNRLASNNDVLPRTKL